MTTITNTVEQAAARYRELKAQAKALEADAETVLEQAVATLPTDGCPEWCRHAPGHAWEAWGGQQAIAQRAHQGVRRGKAVELIECMGADGDTWGRVHTFGRAENFPSVTGGAL